MMMTSRPIVWGIALGIALGVAYAASPLTVWFGIVVAILFAWAGRGLGERERDYVWTLLAIGLAIRVTVLALLFLVSNHTALVSFPWDGDGVYLKYRALAIRNVWAGVPIADYDMFYAWDTGYGWSSYLYVLAYVQYLTAPSPFGIHLVNVAVYVAAAVGMHRLCRTAYGRVPALLGLALMLLLPTLVAWSVSALKEAFYIFVCAAGLLAAIAIARAPGLLARLIAAVVLAALIAASGTIRTGGAAIMIAGLGAGAAASLVTRRALVGLAVAVMLPLAAWGLWQRDGVRAIAMDQLKIAAVRHIGNIRTPGNGYLLLDHRFYEHPSIPSMLPEEGLRFAVRALASFIAVPLPWQVTSRTELLFLPQQVLWYLIVGFAVIGVVAGLKRDALVTCFLAGLAAVSAFSIAITGGNVGTLVRFRDAVVPFVVWLGAVGAATVVARRSRILFK